MLRDVILGPHLNNEGFDPIALHVDNQKFNPDDLEGEIVFSALRHPARVLASFERRIGRDLKEYHNQWGIFIDHVEQYVDCYVHLDNDIKDAEVNKMSDLLGIALNRDWSVTPISGSQCGTHDIVIDDCPGVPQEFIDFYDQTIREMEAFV